MGEPNFDIKVKWFDAKILGTNILIDTKYSW